MCIQNLLRAKILFSHLNRAAGLSITLLSISPYFSLLSMAHEMKVLDTQKKTGSTISPKLADIRPYDYLESRISVSHDIWPQSDYLMRSLCFLIGVTPGLTAQGMRERFTKLLEAEKTLAWSSAVIKKLLLAVGQFEAASPKVETATSASESADALRDALCYKLCQNEEGTLSDTEFSLVVDKNVWMQFQLAKHGLLSGDDIWKVTNNDPNTTAVSLFIRFRNTANSHIALEKRELVSCSKLVPFLSAFTRSHIKLSDIKELTLTANNIIELPENMFADLPGLEHLNLTKNKIARLPKKGSKENKSIKTLTLTSNKLVSFPRQGFPYLEELILDDNELQYVELTQPCLRLVSIKNNNVHGVVVSPLCTGLTQLSLENNSMEYLTEFFFQVHSIATRLGVTQNPLRPTPALRSARSEVQAPPFKDLVEAPHYAFTRTTTVPGEILDRPQVGSIRMIVLRNDLRQKNAVTKENDDTLRAISAINKKEKAAARLKILTYRTITNTDAPLFILRDTGDAYTVSILSARKLVEIHRIPFTSNEPRYIDETHRYCVRHGDEGLQVDSLPLFESYYAESTDLRKCYAVPHRVLLHQPVCFNPTGKFFVIKGINSFYIFEKDKTEAICKLKSAANYKNHCVVFHPTRKVIAIASSKGIELWDFEDNKMIRHFPNIHHYGITKLLYSEDGSLLISVSKDWTIKILNPANGIVLATFFGVAPIQEIFIDQTSQKLVVFFGEGRPARLYDIQTKEMRELKANLNSLYGFSFGNDSTYTLIGRSADTNLLEVWTYEHKAS
jgi:hypothetical protein